MYSIQNASNLSESEINDKERQAGYFKPVQNSGESPMYQPASATSGITNGNVPRFGTVIPNRIFVGGIDFKTKEEDLQKFFCNYGMVKDTKIIRDRADVSKGYGFVTFETSEEADRVRDQEDCLYLNGKKLNIGQAIRKQQICFPKDIHVPGPPGSWVMHPAGYASFTNSNGITYFAQSPVIAPLQQAQPYSHVMNYQPMATHYPGYAYSPAPCSGQAYGTVHLPWPTPIGGACGQLIGPAVNQPPADQVNMVSMQPQGLPTGYIVPRTAASNGQSQVQLAPRPPDQQPIVDKPAVYPPQSESVRVLVSSAHTHPQFVQSVIPQPLYHQPTPIKCAHAQYVAQDGSPMPHYGVITLSENDAHPAMTQAVVTSEGDLLTPPLTPDQQQQ
uniref:protein boule-like isoform X1 n=1 Tax=Ciona intestinalis TaxID=7719 RepID=UPI000180BFDC|nr:protein boule-like isoform X1 [Ciona intestinalis]|eukprot:XP_002124618.1 protein boule-like isoform X1 [Ciona intestinalis]